MVKYFPSSLHHCLIIAINVYVILQNNRYVLRRILRRAIRYAHERMKCKPGMFASLVTQVVEILVCFVVPELTNCSCETVLSTCTNYRSYLLKNFCCFFFQGEAFPELQKDPQMVKRFVLPALGLCYS